MKKINPLIITALFAIVGIYIGVIKIAGAGIERIAEILMAAFAVDTAIDIVCSVLIVSAGFFVFALITAAGIYVTGLFIDWRTRR